MKKITLALGLCAAFFAQAQTSDLPITFDDANVNYVLVSFGGALHSIVADPTNASNNVMRQEKPSGAQTWAGTVVGDSGIATPIPFSAGNTIMTCRVWAANSGLVVRMKVEDRTDGTKSVETEATTTASGWNTLSFDFATQASGTAPINFSYTYNKVVVFSDFGNNGSGTVVYYDDIMFGSGSTMLQVSLPITFDNDSVDYDLVSFGGAIDSIVIDPTNANNKVLRQQKPAGAQTWGGTVLGDGGLANAIPFSAGNTTMRARVWAADAGTPVLMKVENVSNGAISVETIATTTVAGGWQTLFFDFTNHSAGTPALDLNATYGKVVIFCDFGNAGSGKTFYVDDVNFGGSGIGFEETSAIENLNEYPNPSTGLVTISGNVTAASPLTITVMDVNGRMLSEETLNVDNAFAHQLDLSTASVGMYLVRITSNQGTTTQRINITR